MRSIAGCLFVVTLYSCDTTYKNYIASWSPDGQELLFYSDRNGNWDIFRIKSDGSDLRQLTSSPFNEREPKWHPQRNAFVFSSDSLGESRLFLYDFSSNETILLTDLPGDHTSPSLSPDGRYIAYLVNANNEWKLIAEDLINPAIYNVYTGSIYPGRPTWLNGDKVMYSVAVDGKESLQVANVHGAIEKTYVTGYNSCGNAVVSPDGTYILFDAHADDALDSGDGKWEVYKMKTSDHSVTRLTNNNKDDWGARWSPDGSKIAFMGGGLNNTGYDLFVMNADGSGLLQLTHR